MRWPLSGDGILYGAGGFSYAAKVSCMIFPLFASS